MEIGTTLTHFLPAEERNPSEASGDFTRLMSDLITAIQTISSGVNRAGIMDVLGQGGGGCTDGLRRIRGIRPDSSHQRAQVERVKGYYETYGNALPHRRQPGNGQRKGRPRGAGLFVRWREES